MSIASVSPAPMRRVLAGPGSGKTRLLVEELRQRLRAGIGPETMLGITFTRRAAREIQERLGSTSSRLPWLGTFHALARRILADLHALPSPFQLDALIPAATAHLTRGSLPPWLRTISYIAVDEAQDLDAGQVAFLQALRRVSGESALLLVGDPDQAIYGFRQASPRFLLDAERVFAAPFETTHLARNYRSARQIVETARMLLSPIADPQAPCHRLAPVRPEAHPAIRWIAATSPEHEALRIFEEVRTLLALGLRPQDIAILVRVHDQQTVLQAEAARWGVPVTCPPAALRDQLDDGPEPPRAEAVHLLTMHQAKGCEFPVVFLAGIQEGLMPYRKAVSAEARYEELRVLYVAVTRAKQLLWFSYVGQPSRFLGPLRVAGTSRRIPDPAPPTPRPAPTRPGAGDRPSLVTRLLNWCHLAPRR